MKRITWSTLLILPLAFLMMGCEAESTPTAPPVPGPGGGGPAPTGQAAIALSASNPNPLVNSTSAITATVTIDNQPAPPGTAVEFSTTLGSFVENNSNSILRVISNGTALATLTSTLPGTATVTVRVGSVTRTIQITFTQDDTGPPPENAPQVTSISPLTGRPAGGELVTIIGKNFQQPVRVMFGDVAGNVVSVTSTQIQVITPAQNLTTAEQRKEVEVRVISQAGTPDEKSATAPQPFVYELEVLTPTVVHVSPASGPNEGNTRITIFGDGFQPPTRVFFGTGGGPGPLTAQVELEVLTVTFNQIVAMTPPALGLGTDLRDQQVVIRVLNVNTNKEASLGAAFRYGPSMVITAVEPQSGTALGGTRVSIYGWGFDDPVSITIGGVLAQPVDVTGTKIVVITGALLSPCTPGTGEIIVKNIEDNSFVVWGDSTEEPEFDYIATEPRIISVLPNPALPGQVVTIVVRNAGVGLARFRLGSSTVLPSPPQASNPTGDSTFTVTVPAGVQFNSEACTDAGGLAGNRFVPTVVDVTFENIDTDCTDILTGGLTINPTDLSCRVPPDAIVPPSVNFNGPCGGASTPDQVYTVTNAGGSALIITGLTGSFTGFEVRPGSPPLPVTVAPGSSATFLLGINPLPGTTPATPVTGTITLTTNDPTPPTPTSATVTCSAPEAVLPTTAAFTGTCGTPSPDQAYTVTNSGTAALVITGLTSSLAGFDVRPASPPFPVSIAPSASATFQVGITNLPPTTPGSPITGTINITSNDPTTPTATSATVTCTP
jgi:hypothetical protein